MKPRPKGTLCVVGDCIEVGTNENQLSRKRKNIVVKVREYRRRVITRDMYDPYLFYFVLIIFTK